MSTRREDETDGDEIATAILEQVGAAAGLRFDRSSTAERVADVLRELISSGDLPPGTPLREQQLVASFEVSRNTIREAFRLLGRERLVVYQLHRGVAVRELDEHDVHDIYRTRRPLELMAIEYSADAPRESLLGLIELVEEAEAAAAAGDWKQVGTLQHLLPPAPRRADRERANQRILPRRRRRTAPRLRTRRAGRPLLAVHPAQPQDRRAAGRGRTAGRGRGADRVPRGGRTPDPGGRSALEGRLRSTGPRC